ncbi:hypothetical protein SAMN04488104_10152 [Algoriphagus faecimaris]|uniref:Uncharacterized protein n=2 Tax=Algoriphagus faecimaris TaxID=686796 RepID=A0A1G6S2W2_9BACT|nr:hypothetical protein SAMN04488104_10152 [Algoriphagus faecimaris]
MEVHRVCQSWKIAQTFIFAGLPEFNCLLSVHNLCENEQTQNLYCVFNRQLPVNFSNKLLFYILYFTELQLFKLNKIKMESKIQNVAYELAGMIYGISLDGHVNKNEYDQLKAWCTNHEHLCEMEEFKSLHEQINPIIQSGVVTSEEIEDLKEILDNFLEKTGPKDEKKLNMFFLQGLFEGILSSGEVNTYEVYKLNQWIQKNEHLKNQKPFDELYGMIGQVLKNHRISDEDGVKLKSFFSEMIAKTKAS